jgi:hypothetical protein
MAPNQQQIVPGSLLESGLIRALTSAYADLLQRQRSAAAAFVTWTTPHSRSHEFAWLEGVPETLMLHGQAFRVLPTDPVFPSLHKMLATIELNPYERELLYGFPYVIGSRGDQGVRAPLLTIPITLTSEGGELLIEVNRTGFTGG